MKDKREQVNVVVKYIDLFWSIVNVFFNGIWVFMDRGHVTRRTAYWLMWYITFEAYHFCYRAAEAANWDAMAIGAAFGVLTPVSVLQGAVFKFYTDSKPNYSGKRPKLTPELLEAINTVEDPEVRLNLLKQMT